MSTMVEAVAEAKKFETAVIALYEAAEAMDAAGMSDHAAQLDEATAAALTRMYAVVAPWKVKHAKLIALAASASNAPSTERELAATRAKEIVTAFGSCW